MTANNKEVKAKSSRKSVEVVKGAEYEYGTTFGEKVVMGVLVVGIWVSFLIFGTILETLNRSRFGDANERWSYPLTLLIMQSLSNMAFASVFILLDAAVYGTQLTFTGGAPVWDWATAAVGYQGAQYFGHASLYHVSYPIQLVCKSCKPIPVFIGETVISKEKPTLKKFISVLLLCGGVVTFLWYKPSKKKGSTPDGANFTLGMLMVLAALICDGIYGPCQNRIRRLYKQCGSFQLMFNMNLYQLMFTLALGFYSGEFDASSKFVQRYPDIKYFFVKYCAALSTGVVFIYMLQKRCGALIVTKTTTVRKVLSVLASAFKFGHVIAPVQWAAIVVVFTSKFTSAYIAKMVRPVVGARDKAAKQA